MGLMDDPLHAKIAQDARPRRGPEARTAMAMSKGRKEERKKGRKEDRKNGRKEERKRGRKEDREKRKKKQKGRK